VTRLELPKRPHVGDIIHVGGQPGRVAELRQGYLVLDDGTRIPWRLAARSARILTEQDVDTFTALFAYWDRGEIPTHEQADRIVALADRLGVTTHEADDDEWRTM
jgi:hypothetical protein